MENKKLIEIYLGVKKACNDVDITDLEEIKNICEMKLNL